MTLSIYLTFDGNCAEVFSVYADVFDTKPTVALKVSDGPPEVQPGPHDMDKIMHISLPIGSAVLMGSDVTTGNAPPPTHATCVSISHAAMMGP